MKSPLATTLPSPQALGLSGQALRIAAGVILLALSAKVQIPFWPVPMTLQVAAVMAVSATYGMRLGSATLLAYLMAGAAGLPVLAGTPEKIGLGYMLGATGGYLLGFLVASAMVGWAADRLPKFMLLPAMGAGLAVIYALGLLWLAQFVPGDKVLTYGFTPFIAGDLVKITLAAIAVIGAPAGLMRLIRGGSRDA